MAKVNLSWLLLASLVVVVAKCSADNQAYYTAAVYEHKPIKNYKLSQLDNLRANLAVYLKKVEEAAKKGAQIIVFPEYGLTQSLNLQRPNLQEVLPEVVDPAIVKNWYPCTGLPFSAANSVLIKLSCAAKYNGIVVAFNYASRVPCSYSDADCPADKAYLYNTEIVFDSNGTLISRYYKKHLFGESFFNSPKKFDFRTFETSFGKFGVFTCYDIAFKEPAELVKKYQVDSVIYSTNWVDIYPTFLAVEVQSGFARNHEVNVLAANNHSPQYGAVGSGIYAGKYGAINYTMNTSPNAKLIISKVPIKPKAGAYKPTGFINKETVFPSKHAMRSVPLTKFKFVTLKNSSGSITISQKSLTCHLDYEISSKKFVGTYYFGVLDNIFFSLPQRPLAFKVCLVMNIENLSTTKQSIFKKIKLSGNFKPATFAGMFPTIIAEYLHLAPSNEWSYSNGTISSPKGISRPVQLIGLTARDFVNDPQQ